MSANSVTGLRGPLSPPRQLENHWSPVLNSMVRLAPAVATSTVSAAAFRASSSALDADAPGGGAADAHVADALEATAAGADACSPSLKGDKGGKRADRQPEQERQPEKASGSDGIEPGTLGKGWTMVRVKPAYLALRLLAAPTAAPPAAHPAVTAVAAPPALRLLAAPPAGPPAGPPSVAALAAHPSRPPVVLMPLPSTWNRTGAGKNPNQSRKGNQNRNQYSYRLRDYPCRCRKE